MRKTLSPLAALALLCAPAVFALTQSQPPPRQQQPPAPAASPAPATQPTPPAELDDEEVVRITTNLVQLDVIVTDKRGRQITDLKPEDIEVFEDGRRQKITNFSYIQTAPGVVAATPAPAAKTDRNVPAPPPRRLRPEQVRRAVALVVDDLGLSFESTATVRRVLRDYVDKHLGASDLVAVVRTSAGVGALQQFTNDRRQLYAAIERVRWLPSGRGNIGAFSPLRDDSLEKAMREGAGGGRSSADADKEAEDFRQEYFAVGTLGALNFVVGGMRELPGRKSVVLFSDGFSLYTPDRGRDRDDRVLQALRHLTDLANRASVVFYTMDARGLVYTGLTAADEAGGRSAQEMSDEMSERDQQLFDTQQGLQYLADETGGLSVRNSNDLPVRRILEDMSGYYLIGYRPSGTTFDRRFHRLAARLVNRPDLRVRTRKGFYGVAEEALRPAPRTRQQQLYTALTSPFASGGVRMRLTALFTQSPRMGSVLTALIHIDPHDLQLAKQADGQYEAKIDLAGVTFADSGQVVDQHGATQTLRMREETYQRLMREGLVYTLNVPVKKPGAYQLRVAVRDDATERVGSASQFVEVPDLKKDRIALSGIVMNGVSQSAAQAVAAAKEGAVEAGGSGSPAVRRFRRRDVVDYACIVFNPRRDKATGKPSITAQTRLFRDGELIFSGRETPVEPGAQTDPKRLVYGSRLTLGIDLVPGEYTLQVVVTDALRDDKRRTATQWIDFEIVK
jgi:VWFA-related protein